MAALEVVAIPDESSVVIVIAISAAVPLLSLLISTSTSGSGAIVYDDISVNLVQHGAAPLFIVVQVW
eukprot:CAMPEP_0183734090 /NCGR_PEP_ID=MMETSP0737-20130205/42891_1 /TAXON_ID=385413 /ORGANISM="Thalassiosira miniscula, Strain CCMP1093" /LENGTH=66 /DNA_ID=CAMNT_0025967493 /DNA_START=64 /DNA_END=261 /DNA_ORIENTATION=-